MPKEKPITTLKFDQKELHLGAHVFGTSKNFEVEFTNTGKEPLEFTHVQGSCTCTEVTSYPRKPIAPGAKGKIKFVFNSEYAEVRDKYDTGLEMYGNVDDGVFLYPMTVDVKPKK
ncbi:MAG: DUF1573 domain-containing protein [Saprospiraceae bacterium]|nr:DUF1573 domain-containing protein [Saprospiraceae bacterium]